MELFKHNQEAYEAVKSSFEQSDRVAIVHATGTGKSFVIARTAEDYKNVLVVAPNNYVLNETRKVCPSYTTFRTYASLMYDDDMSNSYDLIVLDEFHRAGAEKWGIGIARLIAASPNAKLLGTSATHIRYLDGHRNMADELFEGHVVSRLPLAKAIEMGILPNPTYVSSIYTFDDTLKVYSKRIKDSKRTSVEKDGLCRQLKGIAQNWDNAGGVSSIIRKYFSHDMQRVIVFCSKVKRAAEARKLLSKWFGMAGFGRVRYYNIDYQEKRLEKEMADFQAPMGDYDLKVAISVNMLNEGVHIPRVDGIIMLRSTISRIIIEQQVGRCLTADNKGRVPVVLDLVNNMDLISYDEPIFNDFKTSKGSSEERVSKNNGFPFRVIDECRDVRILLKQLDEEICHSAGYWTKERVIEEAKKYTTRTEFAQNNPVAYNIAHKNGWDEAFEHMDVIRQEITKERCIEVASQCSSRTEFRTNHPHLYSRACSEGWLDEIYTAIGLSAKYNIGMTLEECIEEAKKYKTRSEFQQKARKHYKRAYRMGWMDKVCAHMKIICRPAGYWTKERCAEEARQYKTMKEFREGSPSAHGAAQREGWLIEITPHMKRRTKS